MEMTGEHRIPARREAVWAALNDPEVLKACIPGCEALEKTSDTQMSAKVTAKVGPVKATFTGDVTLSNIDAPSGYTISGEGKGGVAGFAKGGADVKLAEDGDETLLSYVVKAQVGGKLAQLGSRLIDTTAKNMADQFFAAFAARLGAVPEGTSLAGEPAPPPLPTEEGADAAATDEIEDRIEHRVEEEALDLGDTVEDIEEKVEAAAGRGFLGGPYVWGLLALIVVIIVIAILT